MDFYNPDYSRVETLDLSNFKGVLAEVVREWVARNILTTQEHLVILHQALVEAKCFIEAPDGPVAVAYRLEYARGMIKDRLIKASMIAVDVYNDPSLMGVSTTFRAMLDCLDTNS